MNQDIKELLELAAKAAKVAGLDISQGVKVENPFSPDFYFREWNPADDDGDSRRLEVALGLRVDVHRRHPLNPVCAFVEVHGYDSRRKLAEETANDNGAQLDAAVRLAVLRAAAEIGRIVP